MTIAFLMAVLLAWSTAGPPHVLAGFIVAPSYPAGTDPDAVAVGDFNGDGIADLAVAGSDGVHILFGNGDGTFQAARANAAPPGSPVVGDFNGDGIPDLALLRASYSNGLGVLIIMLGKGDGTFHRSQIQYLAGNGQNSLVVGDFNADGHLDLAVANAGTDENPGNTVSVLLGNGDGTFQEPQSYPAGLGPVSLVVGDFNGDGSADLAVANPRSATVSVLLGNGDGSFQAPQSYAASASILAVGDFNGDGRLDFAVADHYAVTVLLGNGDGTFQAGQSYPIGLVREGQLAVGDFNGDGHVDLVVTNQSEGTVMVLPGNGDGTFQAAQAFLVGSDSTSVAVGDLNRDGSADLVVANYESNTVTVLLGRRADTLRAARLFGTDASQCIVVGDFNGDGKPDLALGKTGGVSILLGNGDGTFQATQSYQTGGLLSIIAVGDFNGDGFLDLAVDDSQHKMVYILLGNGDGTFQTAQRYSIPEHGFLFVGDFNGDGKLDLMIGNYLLLGSGDGTFQSPVNTGAVGLPVAVGDFNGDGLTDLVVIPKGNPGGTVSVLLSKGDGTFQAGQGYAVSFIPASVVVGDFNRDGKLDLAVAGSSETGDPISLTILLGNGDGTFQLGQTYAAGLAGVSATLLAADFNGDASLDLAVRESSGVSVLLGNGDGTFQVARSLALVAAQQGGGLVVGPTFAVADFNGDGLPDLVTVENARLGPNLARVTVLLNAADW